VHFQVKFILFSATAALVVIIDQLTKVYVASTMSLHESVAVIGGLFNITYIRNPGAAFGFLAAAGPTFRYIFFLAVTVAAIALILYYLGRSKKEEPLLVFSLSLILAGAVGNLIDRIRLGEVIDFFDVYVGTHHWPAFNCADTAISLGAFLLVLQMVRKRKTEGQTA
jgi:signal peptidase II